MELENLKEGDMVLFNDRKTPLEVTGLEDDTVYVEGPNGGEYEIYRDGDVLLVSRKGSRRYSSYCRDLRKVGKWKRNDRKWTHSKTGSEISIVRNETGHWTIETDLEVDLDLPMYGFSDLETVEKEVEKILRKNPEG